jgi:hypothetical protein
MTNRLEMELLNDIADRVGYLSETLGTPYFGAYYYVDTENDRTEGSFRLVVQAVLDVLGIESGPSD